MANPLPAQHGGKDLGGVKGNNPHHHDARAKGAYKSTIDMSHPTIRPKTNYVERKNSGSDVPVPPELKLP